MTKHSSIEAQVTEILLQNFNKLRGIDLQHDKNFVENLGMDSLDIVILILDIEKVFKIEIPDSDTARISTIGALISYLKTKKIDIET